MLAAVVSIASKSGSAAIGELKQKVQDEAPLIRSTTAGERHPIQRWRSLLRLDNSRRQLFSSTGCAAEESFQILNTTICYNQYLGVPTSFPIIPGMLTAVDFTFTKVRPLLLVTPGPERLSATCTRTQH